MTYFNNLNKLFHVNIDSKLFELLFLKLTTNINLWALVNEFISISNHTQFVYNKILICHTQYSLVIKKSSLILIYDF